MYKLKRIEIALMVGVLVALVWGGVTARAQGELAGSLLRLHVIANSDTAADQANKLAVRDEILALVAQLGSQAGSVWEMEELLASNLPQLAAAGEQALRARGCGQTVTAQLADCYFPTKAYEGFALPAGEYRCLRIVIGEGEGRNWWCVAFPPLCVGASAERVQEYAQAGFFTQEQGDFLAGQGEHYILKFKSMELLGAVKERFFRD